MKLTFNPLTGELDEVVSKSTEIKFTSPTGLAPVGQANGWYEADEYAGSGIVYFFANGNRYKIAATLDNPAGGGAGIPMGLLLTLTYSS